MKTEAAGILVHASLTGYAYETTPNTPILAGQTSGTNSADLREQMIPPAVPRAGLGLLAQGATGLAIWRREDEAVSN